MPLVLRLLGRFDIAATQGAGPIITGARAQMLLARLALAEGGRLERGVLSAMFWADRADAQARASLRQLVWTLRQELKAFPEALASDTLTLRLDPGAMECDVAAFDRLAKSADPADLERALTLYRGELLEGLDLLSLDPEGYFQSQRRRLHDQALQVAGALVEVYRRNRSWDDVVRVARRGLALDPYDAALNAGLMQALQELGRHVEARDQDAAFRHRMKTELGIVLADQPVPVKVRPVSAMISSPATSLADPVPLLPRVRVKNPFAIPVTAVVLALAVAFGLWSLTQGGPPAQGPSESASVVRGLPTTNLQAYDLFLRAEDRRKAAKDDPQLRAAIAVYQQATSLDPAFAEAHAGLALAAVAIAQRRFDAIQPVDTSRTEAYEAAGLALQSDPENARALIVLSRLQAQDGALDMALLSAKRAVLSRPGEAETHANLALLLSRNGQSFQARAELNKLRQLDPVPRPRRHADLRRDRLCRGTLQ